MDPAPIHQRVGDWTSLNPRRTLSLCVRRLEGLRVEVASGEAGGDSPDLRTGTLEITVLTRGIPSSSASSGVIRLIGITPSQKCADLGLRSSLLGGQRRGRQGGLAPQVPGLVAGPVLSDDGF